jgi:hypothetical protein
MKGLIGKILEIAKNISIIFIEKKEETEKTKK